MPERLTYRERTVRELRRSGYSTAEIARTLKISIGRVRSLEGSIRKKRLAKLDDFVDFVRKNG